MSMWDSVWVKNFIVPVIHIQIGIANDVLSNLFILLTLVWRSYLQVIKWPIIQWWHLSLFGRPTVHAVWTNCEVLVFQPWSGTSPNSGFIANFMYKLNSAPPLSTVFCIFHFHSPSVSFRPPHPPPFDLATPLFCTLFSPSYSVLVFPVHLEKHPILPASTARVYARCLSALDFIPRVSLGPWDPRRVPIYSASPPIHLLPFCHPQRCHVPVYPCGWSLIGSLLPPPLTQITPLPLRPWPTARFRGDSRLKSLVSCLTLLCAPSSPDLVLPYILMSSDNFYLFVVYFFVLTRSISPKLVDTDPTDTLDS